MRIKSELKRGAILKAAGEEFLEKGFRDGSLREIAKRVGSTTGIIYTYFRSKDELFKTLVEPAVSEIERFLCSDEILYKDLKQTGIREWFSVYLKFLIEMIERYPDEMDLLFTKSDGSEFENFRDELVETGKKRGKRRFRALPRTGQFEGEVISDFFIHNLVNYIFNISAEIMRQGVGSTELKAFEREIRTFLFSGWKGLVRV